MKTAKVIWFDQKDGNGIITDSNNIEYYIDLSVIIDKQIRSGDKVLFMLNEEIKHVRCAKNVILILNKVG